MSLSSALNSSVSALRSQSAQLAAVSENIANSSTTAYKTKSVNFQSLVTGSGNSTGGGVLYSTVQNVAMAGQITVTGVSTNVAIKGNGFFVVSDNLQNRPSAYNYSRNGNFTTDKSGYLVNDEGYYLLGQRTDENGVVTAANKNDLNSLEPINVNAIRGTAKATTTTSLNLNLPADAVVGATFTSAMEVFDSLGVSHTVTQTWEKTASNAWTLSLSNPSLTVDSTSVSGTLSPSSIDIVFNGDGSLASTSPSPITLAITGYSSGANDSAIALDLGTVGQTDGLTQFSSNTSTPGIEIDSISGDGVRYGTLSSIEIDDAGLVTAVFDNGLRQSVYQIPIATFANPNALTHINGSIYDENQNAGAVVIQLPGVGSAGTLVAEALEESTTDTSEEFNKMIVAQQAYSAAAQVISTVSTMYDTLLQAVR
jgi:flagellar hook protein FlgE